MSDKLEYVTGQQQFKFVSEHVESRKRAAANTQSKIEAKLNTENRSNYINVEDDVSASIIRIYDNKQLIIRAPTSPQNKSKSTNDKMSSIDMVPGNGTHFSLRESVIYLNERKMTQSGFFQVRALPNHNPSHPRILCSKAIFSVNTNII